MGFRALRALSWPPVAAVVLLFFTGSQAWAWGNTGHRIIADIAWDHLNAATLEKLRPFLGDYNLASISTWPDDVRSGRSETAPWHYVDIPKDAPGYEAKYCPDDNCVVEQIRKFAHIVGDSQRPFAERSEALKFLVHFVGDISQPLHAVADARGGNDMHLTVFGSTQCGEYACNFHSVWDSSLIDHTGLSEHAYAQQLEKMIATTHLKPGSEDPATWANDSLQLARQAWVAPQASIDAAYYDRERPVVDRQLALAGLRLARLLNEEMKNTGKS